MSTYTFEQFFLDSFDIPLWEATYEMEQRARILYQEMIESEEKEMSK